jgi:hypothetical protein
MKRRRGTAESGLSTLATLLIELSQLRKRAAAMPLIDGIN